jgi:sulfate permease, SulP family
MSPRYRDALASLSQAGATLGYGLRSRLKEGYRAADLRADLAAGVAVGVVALPLSMALAIASGVAPQHGLYTAIIGGSICALLGGTRSGVNGPTAAFVAVLVPIVGKFGLGGLLVAGFMAGLIQLAMGVARMGRLITFIPHPVTTGFTSGIAVVLATIQLKDLLGLHFPRAPHSYYDFWRLAGKALPAVGLDEMVIAAVTIALLLGLPRLSKRLPVPLVTLVAVALIAVLLERLVPGFDIDTIGSRFRSVVDGQVVAGVPSQPPMPLLPWRLPGPGGDVLVLDLQLVQTLLPSAFAIAMLGAIETLLSAVIADGLSGDRHEPNSELMALGIANMACPFFGGIAVSGALTRTVTNIRAGSRSPLSAVMSGVVVLASTVVLAPLVSYLPMAALAALLLLIARNIFDFRHFGHLLRVAPRSDTLVLLVCFFLTVFSDMVVAVSVGVVLAALLFMGRMAEITNTRLDVGTMTKMELPPGVLLYEIAGPLFFGAAQKAFDLLQTLGGRSQAIIIYMAQVPAMDATGLVALESLLGKLRRSGAKVVLTGLQPAVRELLTRAGIKREPGRLAFAPDLDAAMSIAIIHRASQPSGQFSLKTNPGLPGGVDKR